MRFYFVHGQHEHLDKSSQAKNILGFVSGSRGSHSGYSSRSDCNNNGSVASRRGDISCSFMERMNRGLSSSSGIYYGGGGGNFFSSWNEDRLYYVDTNKCSGEIISHDDCWRKTVGYIVKVRSEDGMGDKNSRLDDIRVERDHENDREYDGESRRSSSLSRCDGEGRERGEWRGGDRRKKGSSSRSDSLDADLEHGISALTDTNRFNSGDNETSGGSLSLLK